MSRPRYRQMVLFLVVLILPSVAIVVAGRKLANQDTQLAVKDMSDRAAADRRIAVDAVGRELVDRLDRIKEKETANTLAGSLPGAGADSDPAIAAVGWLEGDRVLWPWETDAGVVAEPSGDVPFTHVDVLADAGRAEIGSRDYASAAHLYRAALASAISGREKASAQLGLARSLWQIGLLQASVAAYLELLQSPADLSDEYGLPFASYAVEPLLDLGAPENEVLQRVAKALAPPAKLTRLQTLRWESGLTRLAGSKDMAIRDATVAVQERLAARAQDLDAAAALQKDFTKLRFTTETWQPWRTPQAKLWLVGRTSAGPDGRTLLIAVRGERLFKSFEPRFDISDSADGGDLLSSLRLPGLRARSTSADANALPILRPPFLGLSLWGLSFTLIVMLTFVLGYLLWRDARRDMHIAELRTQFVSSVSHELKTPLTSIRMFAEILQMRGNADPQLHREYLETIVNESERLTRLLNNVLDFSRIERGQKTYRFEPTSLPDVIHAAVRTIQYPLSEQGFTLHVDISNELPRVAVDRDAIQQAVLNLLTNAMKYSGKQRDIELRVAADRESVIVEVTDHGLGIPEAEQARIFEKFYRAPVPENRSISGTGLGLSLVTHIVQAHSGSVQVRSKPNEGSTFTLRIPLQLAEESVRV